MFARRRVHGDDRPVILVIHGAATNSQRYEDLTRELYDSGLDTLSVDLPGHGKTLMKSGVVHVSFAQQGHYITEMLEHYRIRRAIIYGHSMGAGPAVTATIEFKRAGGEVPALFLDDPYVMPLEDFYHRNQDLMLSSKVSKGVKKVGTVGMVAGALLCFTPLGLTGIPQATLVGGALTAATGKIGNYLTNVCSTIAVPLVKKHLTSIVQYKIEDEPEIYEIDGRLPADAETMARGAAAAFDPIDMREIAPGVGQTRTVILMGLANAQVPDRLMRSYEKAIPYGAIVHIDEDRLQDTRPHLHPMDAPHAVRTAILSVLRDVRWSADGS